MYFPNVLPSYSHKVLDFIMLNEHFSSFYLAGGTALALQIGHRESIDLDFFTQENFNANIISSFTKFPFVANTLQNNNISLIANDTKVTFLYWPFPKLKNLVTIGNVRLLNPQDIGLLKLLALQGRHTRKDIIDLYFIDKEVITFESLFELFEKYYPKESFNIFGSVKELFDDSLLQKQPMPKMFKEVEFELCLDYVQKKVAACLKGLIKL